MANYVSFGDGPQAQGRPWDAMAGVDASKQGMAAQVAKMRTLEMMATEHAQRQAELQRYQGETPNKLAESDLAGMVARDSMAIPGYGRSIGQGRMGEADQNWAKGQVALGTMNSDIGRKVAENEVTTAEQAERLFSTFEPAMKAAGSPLEAQASYNEMLQRIPERARAMFPKTYGPQVHQLLAQMRQAIIQNPAHNRTMEAERLKSSTAITVGKGNNDATRYAADQRALRAGGAIKTLMQQHQAAKTPEAAIYTGEMLLANPDLNEIDRKQVEASVAAAKRIVAEKMARGSFDMSQPSAGPGALAAGVNERLSGPGAAPQAPVHGKTKEGYDIIGRNADGSLRIRDPKTGRTGTMKP